MDPSAQNLTLVGVTQGRGRSTMVTGQWSLQIQCKYIHVQIHMYKYKNKYNGHWWAHLPQSPTGQYATISQNLPESPRISQNLPESATFCRQHLRNASKPCYIATLYISIAAPSTRHNSPIERCLQIHTISEIFHKPT